MAIGAVLDREALEMADFLYRKRLTASLLAIKTSNRQQAITRGRLDNARNFREGKLVKTLYKALKLNVERRKEMKKDAITRQVMDEEAGEDEFFQVQIRVQGTKTATRDLQSWNSD